MTTKESISTLNIAILNGVNLDLLGRRETSHYGTGTLLDLEQFILENKKNICTATGIHDCNISFFQTNSECKFLDYLSQPWDGALINAGAWTHTSLAISDRLIATKLPFVEVHLSNVFAREPERHKSYLSAHALGITVGFGFLSYTAGLFALLSAIKSL